MGFFRAGARALLVVLLLVLVVLVALAAGGSAGWGGTAGGGPAAAGPRHGGWDAAQVYARVLGPEDSGRPSVIFISGLGNDHVWWNWDEGPEEVVRAQGWARNGGIQKPVAALTRTLSFDMPGVGRSPVASPDEVPGSFRDAARLVYELGQRHRLPAPWVVVGHSIGGATALVLQDEHPELVKGVVLVDAPSPATLEEIGAPGFYTKTGALKYEVTRRYLANYHRSRAEVPFAAARARRVVAHVNLDDPAGARDQAHAAHAVSAYADTTVHTGATHWIHVTDPAAVLRSITAML